MSRPKDVTEATELACLLGYCTALQLDALNYFVGHDCSAEEAFEQATIEWKSTRAFRDSKED